MADLDKITKKPIGELLVGEGIVTSEQVDEALRIQKRTGEFLGQVLIRKGYTTETLIVQTLCEQFGRPFLPAASYDIPPDVLDVLPPRLLIQHCFVPLDRIGDVLIIAMGGLIDAATLKQIRRLSGCEVEVFISPLSEVNQLLERVFPSLYDPLTHQPLLQADPHPAPESSPAAPPDHDRIDHEVTREFQSIAEEDSDWEALFEEAERAVTNELQDRQED